MLYERTLYISGVVQLLVHFRTLKMGWFISTLICSPSFLVKSPGIFRGACFPRRRPVAASAAAAAALEGVEASCRKDLPVPHFC